MNLNAFLDGIAREQVMLHRCTTKNATQFRLGGIRQGSKAGGYAIISFAAS